MSKRRGQLHCRPCEHAAWWAGLFAHSVQQGGNLGSRSSWIHGEPTEAGELQELRATVGLSDLVTLDPLRCGQPEPLWARCGGKCIWSQLLRSRDRKKKIMNLGLAWAT